MLRHNVFYLVSRHCFAPDMIYTLAETEVTTEQAAVLMITEAGKAQVGCVPSAAEGERVTVVCAVSAVGVALPPLFVLPGTINEEHFITGAPKGTIAASTKSGCISEETFSVFLEHIAQQGNCSSSHPMLLILDGHEAHCSLKAAETARTNGIIKLTVPPHTSHQLLPLEKTVFGPFRASYNKALDGWMQSNPGKTMTIDDIPQCLNKAFLSAMTSQNITSGFKSTGIFPYNRGICCEAGLESSVPFKRLNRKLQSDADVDPLASDTLTYSGHSNLHADGQPGSSEHRDIVILPTSLHPIMGQNRRKRERRKAPTETPYEQAVKEAEAERMKRNRQTN